MRALITQRENVDSHGIHLDVLEAEYITFFEELGIDVWAVSNFRKDTERILDEFAWDFAVITGGGSIPNEFYATETHDTQQLNRDMTEKSLIEGCIRRGIPVLAICRGMQYINGLWKGKVSHLDHLKQPRPIGKDHSVFCHDLNREILVNNYHNDGIEKEYLAEEFMVSAMDMENSIVEAFYSDSLKIYAMQWHPERKFETQEAKEDSRNLVLKFIKKYVEEGRNER